MKSRTILILILSTFFASAAWPQAQPQWKHKIITYEVPGAGNGAGQGTQAFGINSSGEVAGFYTDANSGNHYNFTTVDSPGLYQEVDNGNFVTWVNNSGLVSQQYVGIDGNIHTAVLLEDGWEVIDVPGATNTEGTNANSQGQIALTYWGADGVTHLAIWKEGQYSYVNDPCPAEYTYGLAVGINDLGQVTSYVVDSNGISLACVGSAGKHPIFPYRGAVFGFPGAVSTIPIMTNDLGVTVGAYWDAQGVQHGFVHRMIGNVFTSVDFPRASNSWVQGINDEGMMNGSAQLNTNGNWAGFEMIGGNIEDWNVPDAVQTDLFVITNDLRVAGLYQSPDGVWHGFVATPR